MSKCTRSGAFTVFIAVVFLSNTGLQTVSALDPKQRSLYNKKILYYDIESCQDVGASAGSEINSEGSEGNSGEIYSSGLTAPFIIEQWAIHTLKAIAKKRNVPEADVVTKEHVIALLAFAKGEGGDINNTSSIFNPLNTGINSPDLLAGAHAGNGTQSFKSFDAGVEGVARTMVGSNQNRLALVLTKKDSTAAQFMNALTYFKKYKGNNLWAEASTPDPDGYYKSRLALVKQVRTNYKDFASLVIGTQQLEEPAGKRAPEKLTFDGSTNITGDVNLGDSSQSGCQCSSPSSNSGSTTLIGSGNTEKAFNYFVNEGKATPVQAAGIVGNFMLESGINLDTRASNGTHKGIAQWDIPNRWAALLRFADEQDGDKSPYSLSVQLAFALQEAPMKTYLETNPSTPGEAAEKFEAIFERSGGSALDKRKSYAQEVFDQFGSKAGASGGTSDSAGCPGSVGAFIEGTYAWPVELNKADSSAGYPLPCRQSSCHHDGSAAFDLAHKDTVKGGADTKSTGKAVFAITDGELAKAGIYQGITGCYSIQFKSEDGYVYWYGHLRRPVSTEVGKKFKVGEKIAEIGERKCTGNGSYPHLHIDRGSPKGSFGGSVGSRDSGMNDVINKLYEKLP